MPVARSKSMLHHSPRGRKVAFALSALSALAMLTSPSTVAFAAGLAQRLVGTWRIVRFIDTDPNGKVTYPFGERPRGYIVYDATGHLSVQIMRMPAQSPFAAGDRKSVV
jgi:hypothetical protein